MTRRIVSAVLAILAAAPLAAQQKPDLAPYLMSDRPAEIALARTAAPSRISDSATVLVLTRTGYTEAARGTNGWTCMVFRSFSAGLDDPNFWNAKVRAPQCLNAPAVKTVLPAMLKQVEWVMGGVSKTDIGSRIAHGYFSRDFPAPAPGAMSYMLSHEQYLVDDDPHWMPHLMFFFDKSMPPAQLGAGGYKSAVIDGTLADAHAPVLTVFIPVRQWSDGTPAMSAAGQ